MRDDELAGTTLAGRYDVIAPIGSGGMGSVYRARDRELDEEIALKVIHSELARQPDNLERFRREVKLARRVTHRNVARTFELGHADDFVFCTMELVAGETLRHRLKREKHIAVQEAIGIARELCAGLAAAHAAGVIHRDIKPDNVMIAPDGRIVLADFGVAAATLDAANEISGTVGYMAPEQALGEAATPATDIYSVGVVLYEMISGERAFRGDEGARRKFEVDHLALANVDREIAEVVARATARERRHRFTSASELDRALATFGATTATAPPTANIDVPIRTVIVLPPRAAEGLEHVALALHEAVLARLGETPHLRVLPRSNVEPADSVVDIAGGTVTISRRAGSPIVLTVPLAIPDIEAGAAAVAAAVAGAIDAPPPVSGVESAALDLLLRARERLQRGFADIQGTLDLLERANSMMPNDARIIAALAFCQVRVAFFFGDASSDRIDKARELVRIALESKRPEALLAAGHLEHHAGNPVRAAGHFRAAISRAPYLAEAHEHLGRMLLEAGHLETGLARMQDAIAMAPVRAIARWDIARLRALQDNWNEADRITNELIAANQDRWFMRARFAWWRRDREELSRLHAEHRPEHLVGDIPILIGLVNEVIAEDAWARLRSTLVDKAVRRSASRRRDAFSAQIAAELAGYFHDVDTCREMIFHAAESGCYDLFWLDHCPLLEGARDRHRHAFERRSRSILDAMYGDYEIEEISETAVF